MTSLGELLACAPKYLLLPTSFILTIGVESPTRCEDYKEVDFGIMQLGIQSLKDRGFKVRRIEREE